MKPLLADDSLAPDAKPAPTTGPSSVAEQLDAMKGSGTTLQTSETATEPPLDLFKGKEVEASPATNANGNSAELTGKADEPLAEPENPIDASVPGTEIAPDHPGHSVLTSFQAEAVISPLHNFQRSSSA